MSPHNGAPLESIDMTPPYVRSTTCLAAGLALLGTAPMAADRMPALIGEVTTETGMPHLEEALRYTITRETRCLAHQDLATAFPILSHPALAGCRLDDASHREDTVSFQLTCPTGHGTSGHALWQIGERQIRGTLDVKLGGKNMTFYQRVTIRLLSSCAP